MGAKGRLRAHIPFIFVQVCVCGFRRIWRSGEWSPGNTKLANKVIGLKKDGFVGFVFFSRVFEVGALLPLAGICRSLTSRISPKKSIFCRDSALSDNFCQRSVALSHIWKSSICSLLLLGAIDFLIQLLWAVVLCCEEVIILPSCIMLCRDYKS